MKNTHILIIFIVSCFISVTCVNSNAMPFGGSAADFLVKVGEDHLENGEVEMAIHEFQKALLLDSSHAGATEHLRKMGLGSGGPTTDKTHRAEMARLGRIIQEQNAQIEKLKRSKTKTIRLFGKNKEAEKDQFWETSSVYDDFLLMQPTLTQSQQDQIDYLNNMSAYYKNNITDKELDEIDSKMLRAKYYDSLENSLMNGQEMLRLSRENSKLKKYTAKQWAHQEKIIRVLEEYVDLHEAKLQEMGNEVTLAKIAEAQKELQMLVNMTESAGVNDEHRARLDLLNQKIEELEHIKG